MRYPGSDAGGPPLRSLSEEINPSTGKRGAGCLGRSRATNVAVFVVRTDEATHSTFVTALAASDQTADPCQDRKRRKQLQHDRDGGEHGQIPDGSA
jgi:hypothetical protein